MEPHVIAMYNPANAKNLSEAEVAAMQAFSREDVIALSQAYPNTATGGTYLVLRDKTKKDNEQIFPRSTWKNLFELWKVGQTQWVPWTFSSLFTKKNAGLKVADTQDLSHSEAKEEIKKAGTQTLSETADNTSNLGTGAEQNLSENTGSENGGSENGTEGNQGTGSEGSGSEGPVVYTEAGFNKLQLQEAYKAKFNEDPDTTWTKKELVGLLNGQL